MNRPAKIVFLLALALAPCSVYAQQYPSKPITIIDSYAPGGTTDYFARVLAQKLLATHGWQLIIVNKPGADARIGTAFAARAAPDGYTLAVAPISTHAINPFVFKNLDYDVRRDFVGITLLGKTANVVAVHPSVPANNVRELIAYAKKNPGKLAFSSPGVGSSVHVAGEIFKSAAGVDILHVPFKGSALSMNAVLGGEVQILFGNISGAAELIKGGRLKALAVTSPQRQAAFPQVPSLEESGLKVDVQAWWGMFAPSATPKEIVQQLNSEFVKVLNMPDVRAQVIARGIEPVPLTLSQFDVFWKAEMDKYADIVKKANISLD